jgi:hypothetical protein
MVLVGWVYILSSSSFPELLVGFFWHTLRSCLYFMRVLGRSFSVYSMIGEKIAPPGGGEPLALEVVRIYGRITLCERMVA